MITTKVKLISCAVAAVAVAVLALALTSCQKKPTSQAASQTVKIRLKWLHQAQFAGFYVAKEKGFYNSKGLDVTLEPGGSDFPAVQMVASGSDDFGVTGADQILLAREKGVALVAVAVIYRKSPFVYFSLKDSGITKPQEFVDKPIAVKLGGNEELTYRAMMAKVGVDTAKIHEIPVKYDMSPLFSGQVKAWPGYSINEPIVAEEKGYDVNLIWPSDYGVTLYADTLFTTEKLINDKPDLVLKVVEATLEGWNYAVTHPDEAVSFTLKQSDQLNREHETRMMQASIPLLKPDGEPIGSMDKARWAEMQNLLLGAGFMKRAVDINGVFTDRFLHK